MNRRSACVLLLAAAALLLAAVALADGDPASDVLVSKTVFLPAPPPSSDAASALQQQVDAVYKRGDRIKVAVIATPNDLGSVPSLFGRPAAYASFLGQELGLAYAATLLVVMPGGFGVYERNASTAAADAVLKKVTIAGSSPDDLAKAAGSAVGQLLSAGLLHYRDTLAPTVFVFPAKARRGTEAKLTYAGFDDSGRVAVVIHIRDGKTLATLEAPLGAVNPNAIYTLSWKVPARLARGLYRYCAQATDPNGNKSAQSCATLTVS